MTTALAERKVRDMPFKPKPLEPRHWLRHTDGFIVDPGLCPVGRHNRGHWTDGDGDPVTDPITGREVVLAKCRCSDDLADDAGRSEPKKVVEYRPGRNWIREGDFVKIGPSRPGKRDGFVARVLYFTVDPDTDEVRSITVQNGVQRTLPIDRLVGKTAKAVRV